MRVADGSCLEQGHDRFAWLRRGIASDIDRYLTKSPENLALGRRFKTRLSAFLTPELQCLLLYRLSHWAHVQGWPRLARVLERLNFALHKASITPQSCIGPGCRLSHPPGVFFHGRAGSGLTLFSMAICGSRDDALGGPAELGPTLGERVLVGAHAVILGPARVGNDVKIAFSVRLERDVPDGVVVVSKSLRQSRRPLSAPRKVEHALE